MGFFDKIKRGLNKTRNALIDSLNTAISSFTKIDEELIEELEEILIMSDIGVKTASDVCNRLRVKIKENRTTDPAEVTELLKEILCEMTDGDSSLHLDTQPSVIMVIGVNGVGKTTTAKKIVDEFGEDTLTVLEFDPIKLSKIRGISKQKAIDISK